MNEGKQKDPVANIGIHFMKFRAKWDLQRMSDNVPKLSRNAKWQMWIKMSQKMFDEIRHPENDKKWIYESAEIGGVSKLYKREFGAEPQY